MECNGLYIYIGFDDTDHPGADRGTGKLARWIEKALPADCSVWGVVRQQLLVDDAVPYTSHNSSACVVLEAPRTTELKRIFKIASDHVEEYALEGSNPGVCVAQGGNGDLSSITDFGLTCTRRVVDKNAALQAAPNAAISGFGKTREGMIGAVAAVGLTAGGWNGRFIEYGGLRNYPDSVDVDTLMQAGIMVVSMDRDAKVPAPDEVVHTNGWLRPRLWGHQAVLGVVPDGEGQWISLGKKREKGQAHRPMTVSI
jgi:tRNA(Ile2) C34 agmatinyltransferase TiaS